MALNLDLAQSDAKIARARHHFEALDREIKRLYAKGDPYHISVSEVDKDGWCSAFLHFHDLSEYDFGAIVGDLIHNLRSALDYIVTALVDHSLAALNTRHQFPIFETEAGYRKRVGTDSAASSGGMLGGVTVALKEIWNLQPFHQQPGPEKTPLWAINRLSNADKHRSIIAYLPFIKGGNGNWIVNGGKIVTLGVLTPLPINREPNREYEVGRVRIIGAPTKVRYEAEITVGINFGTAAFMGQYNAFEINANALKIFCNHVAMIVDAFKKL